MNATEEEGWDSSEAEKKADCPYMHSRVHGGEEVRNDKHSEAQLLRHHVTRA